MMRSWSIFLLFIAAAGITACSGPQAATPLETFKTYTKAIKQKDVATMKLLLSDATIKMHEKEAKSLNIPLDEVIKRQTLFGEDQTSVEFRNEKIDGQKATLEVKNRMGNWETVPFVFEGGAWKIDTAGAAEQMMREIEEQQNRTFGDPTTAAPMTEPMTPMP